MLCHCRFVGIAGGHGIASRLPCANQQGVPLDGTMSSPCTPDDSILSQTSPCPMKPHRQEVGVLSCRTKSFLQRLQVHMQVACDAPQAALGLHLMTRGDCSTEPANRRGQPVVLLIRACISMVLR